MFYHSCLYAFTFLTNYYNFEENKTLLSRMWIVEETLDKQMSLRLLNLI